MVRIKCLRLMHHSSKMSIWPDTASPGGEYQGAGTQMFYYSLGLHAGFYSLPKGPFKKLYDSSLDYDGRFDSGYEEGLEERDDWFKDNE